MGLIYDSPGLAALTLTRLAAENLKDPAHWKCACSSIWTAWNYANGTTFLELVAIALARVRFKSGEARRTGPRVGASSLALPATTDPDEAARWMEDLPHTGIEGLVIKGNDQPYTPGARSWLNLKHRETVEITCGAVIGPITEPHEVVAGLVLDGELRIVGLSTPLETVDSRELARWLHPPKGNGHLYKTVDLFSPAGSTSPSWPASMWALVCA